MMADDWESVALEPATATVAGTRTKPNLVRDLVWAGHLHVRTCHGVQPRMFLFAASRSRYPNQGLGTAQVSFCLAPPCDDRAALVNRKLRMEARRPARRRAPVRMLMGMAGLGTIDYGDFHIAGVTQSHVLLRRLRAQDTVIEPAQAQPSALPRVTCEYVDGHLRLPLPSSDECWRHDSEASVAAYLRRTFDWASVVHEPFAVRSDASAPSGGTDRGSYTVDFSLLRPGSGRAPIGVEVKSATDLITESATLSLAYWESRMDSRAYFCVARGAVPSWEFFNSAAVRIPEEHFRAAVNEWFCR